MGLKPGSHKFIIHPNIVRQVFFLALLIIMGFVIVNELYFLIGALLGAVTLYVILMHRMKYMAIILRWNPTLAALMLMLLSFIVMIIPLAYMGKVAIDKISPVISNPELINDAFMRIHEYLLREYNIDALNQENVQKISERVIPFTQKTLGSTINVLGNIAIMYLILYFLLVNNREVEKWLRQNLPFKTKNVKTIITDFRALVYSNALGIPLVALVQGLAGLIGYWIFGVEEFVLMGILTAISSVIPIIGSLAIYLPLAVYQFVTAGTLQGIGVLLWGFLVIGSVDNIARFMIQRKLADVHPLVTLLGVMAGISLFGFVGVIFGPLLISVFFILVRIYVDEYGKVDANRPDAIT